MLFRCFGFPGSVGRGSELQPPRWLRHLPAATSTGASRDECGGWGRRQAMTAPAPRHERHQQVTGRLPLRTAHCALVQSKQAFGKPHTTSYDSISLLNVIINSVLSASHFKQETIKKGKILEATLQRSLKSCGSGGQTLLTAPVLSIGLLQCSSK